MILENHSNRSIIFAQGVFLEPLCSYAIVISGQKDNLQILLVKKKDSVYQNKWCLPGGLLEGRNEILDSCVEDLARQTNLFLHRNNAVELTKRERKGRDPRGPIVAHPFVFFIEEEKTVSVGENIEEVRWMSLLLLKELPLDQGAMLCEAMGKFWRQMPSFDIKLKSAELPALFVKKKLHYRNDEMIYFGGSFNPWHPGHMECLKICPSENITVVPDYNPWKKIDHKGIKCFWSEYRNLCLVLKDTPYAVYPGFWGREGPNPTVGWIPNLKVEKRGLLLGDDSFCNILKWQDSEILITFLGIIYVVPRIHKNEEMEEVKKQVLEIHPNMKIEILSEHEYMHESSTLIREKKKKN